MLKSTALVMHEFDLEIQPFNSYALIIDARSPREYAEDHIPGAMNLPVVDDIQYDEVGTLHRSSKHHAYLKGVAMAMENIAGHIREVIAAQPLEGRMLVYCFRGGKRSKLWADNLRTMGYDVDTLPGGWKAYRHWVRSGLDRLPMAFEFVVLGGPTGVGKTRLLSALQAKGAQVLDLEALAKHRGSLIGAVPGQTQPTQKLFDSLLLERLRRFDPTRPVWVEAESKKIGGLQLPERLVESMRSARSIFLEAPMEERVRLWKEDYGHFESDLPAMVRALLPVRPIVGGPEYERWESLASNGDAATLFERIMTTHYDPAYARSTQRNRGVDADRRSLYLSSLAPNEMTKTAGDLIEQVDRSDD